MAIRYSPDRKGTLDLAQSAGVGGACLAAAQRVKAAAEAVPIPNATSRQVASYRAAFKAMRADVTMAKSGERRAGAIVLNDHKLEQLFGGRSRALYSALQAMDGVVIE